MRQALSLSAQRWKHSAERGERTRPGYCRSKGQSPDLNLGLLTWHLLCFPWHHAGPGTEDRRRANVHLIRNEEQFLKHFKARVEISSSMTPRDGNKKSLPLLAKHTLFPRTARRTGRKENASHQHTRPC